MSASEFRYIDRGSILEHARQVRSLPLLDSFYLLNLGLELVYLFDDFINRKAS